VKLPTAAVRSCAVLVALTMPAHADGEETVRCSSGRLVDVGMIDSEVVARCGEPKSRTVEEVPVFNRNPRNRTVAPTGDVTRIERWIYERGHGRFEALLTFENGKLSSIDLLTKP
jgi:hypothetical protein